MHHEVDIACVLMILAGKDASEKDDFCDAVRCVWVSIEGTGSIDNLR